MHAHAWQKERDENLKEKEKMTGNRK